MRLLALKTMLICNYQGLSENSPAITTNRFPAKNLVGKAVLVGEYRLFLLVCLRAGKLSDTYAKVGAVVLHLLSTGYYGILWRVNEKL